MQREEKAIYTDPVQPVDARVADLLARMTLDEKLGQLGSVWVYELFDGLSFSELKAAQLMAQGIGQITRLGGASSLTPTACAEMAAGPLGSVVEFQLALYGALLSVPTKAPFTRKST